MNPNCPHAFPARTQQVFEPAKGLRFDIKIRSNIFLWHPLEHLRMATNIIQEPFAGIFEQLVKIAVILFYEQIGNKQPPKCSAFGYVSYNSCRLS